MDGLSERYGDIAKNTKETKQDLLEKTLKSTEVDSDVESDVMTILNWADPDTVGRLDAWAKNVYEGNSATAKSSLNAIRDAISNKKRKAA